MLNFTLVCGCGGNLLEILCWILLLTRWIIFRRFLKPCHKYMMCRLDHTLRYYLCLSPLDRMCQVMWSDNRLRWTYEHAVSHLYSCCRYHNIEDRKAVIIRLKTCTLNPMSLLRVITLPLIPLILSRLSMWLDKTRHLVQVKGVFLPLKYETCAQVCAMGRCMRSGHLWPSQNLCAVWWSKLVRNLA